MLLWRRTGCTSRLVARTSSASAQHRAGLFRFDHRVDEAALGGAVRVVERGLVLGDERSLGGSTVVGVCRAEALAVQDLHRGRAAHHRDLRARPRDAEVVADARESP